MLCRQKSELLLQKLEDALLKQPCVLASLVINGIDEVFRSKAHSLKGPICSYWIWEQALAMAS